MMARIPGTDTFYAANNKNNKIEYDITIKREALPQDQQNELPAEPH